MSWLPFLLFLPLIWALYRRFDAVTITVTMGMALSMLCWPLVGRDMLPPLLALVDLAVAAVLVKIVFYEMNAGGRGWTDTAHRAQFIGIAGVAKVSIWLSVFHGGLSYGLAAWGVNLLLLYQILVAGGIGHEGLIRFGRSVAGLFRNGVLHGKNNGVA